MHIDDQSGLNSPQDGSLETLSPPLESYNSALQDMEDQVNAESSGHIQPLLCRLNSSQLSPRTRMEHEKRLRREIANSNERRRMQSINTGFQNLKALLPKRDGEKMSKASILQQSVQFIRRLQAEKIQLLQQNLAYKQILEVSGTLPPSNMSPPAMTESIKSPVAQDVKPERPSTPRQNGPVSSSLESASPSSGDSSSPPSQNSGSPLSQSTLLEPKASVKCETPASGGSAILAPPKKRRKFIDSSELSDEGVCMSSDSEILHQNSKIQNETTPMSNTSQESQLPKSTLTNAKSQPSGEKTLSPVSPVSAGASIPEASSQLHGIYELDLMKREMLELRLALDRERRSRVALEDHVLSSADRNKLSQNFCGLPLRPDLDGNKLGSMESRLRGVMSSAGNIASNGALFYQQSPVSQIYTPQPRMGGLPLPIVGSSANSVGSMVSSILPLTPPALGKPSSKSSANIGSKQNLEVIVEAIRHLEGDQLFVQSAPADSTEKEPGVSGHGAPKSSAFQGMDHVSLIDRRLLLEQQAHAAFLAAANYRNQQTQRLVQQGLVSSALSHP